MHATKLVAHRGDNTNYPENSYAGIKAALQAGALFIEFDVQMNADNTLLVLHDPDFKRTANLNQSLFDTRNGELSNISVHEPDRFAKQHYPTPLSTLSEIMTLASEFPSVTVFVEIKQESLDHFGLEVVMDKLLTELKTHVSQAVIISFSFEAIGYTQQHSDLKTGWVLEKYDKKFQQRALVLKPEYVICNYLKILQHKLWKGNWKWVVYTINETGLAQQMLDRGVDLVETNNISLLLNAD